MMSAMDHLLHHSAAEHMPASYLARIVSVDDKENLSRVQVRLLNYDGLSEQDGPIWARVALPFAGSNRGVCMLPDVNDEGLRQFVNGGCRFRCVDGGVGDG